MPLRSLLQSLAFSPDETKSICEAFDGAWLTIQKSGIAYTNGSEVRLRELLAKRILAMAQSGVLDRMKLADGAVEFVLKAEGQNEILGRA